MKRACSSRVICTSEGGSNRKPLTAPSNHWAPTPSPPPHPPSLTSCSATGQKLLQVKHESKGGRAEKKLGVCWSENSRGHELPAVVFNAALHGAKSAKRFISDLITSTRFGTDHILSITIKHIFNMF